MTQVKMNIIYQQWFAATGVTMLLVQLGIMGGWVSPTLARLMNISSEIPLSTAQASWVASLVNIGRFFGGILGAVLTNFIGSKKTILVSVFPISIGWLIIALADSVELLLVARLFCGLGLGLSFSTFPLYIGEVSLPEIRGAVVSLATVGSSFGQIVASVLGPYLSISLASFIYFGHSVLLIAVFLWLPESPHHLMKIGDKEGARKSIAWYRNGKGVEEEVEAVEKFVASDRDTNFWDKLKEFKTPHIRKATIQIIALFTFMQMCGLNSIIFYMETILKRANFTLIDPSLVVICVNTVCTCSAAVSIFLIDSCGRKFLLLISSSGITISMITLCAHFILLGKNVDMNNLQWLPMASLFLFMISFFLGLMPVPSTVLGEIFPAHIKCIAACIASLTGATMSFISAKTYQPMVDAMGEPYVFLIYAILTAMLIPYTLFAMEETKGKSLQQIQDDMSKG